MPAGDAFQVEGVIGALHSPRTARVRLPNGHEVFGYVPGRRRSPLALVVGRRVLVQLSPHDLSEGRILKSLEDLNYEGSRVSQETV